MDEFQQRCFFRDYKIFNIINVEYNCFLFQSGISRTGFADIGKNRTDKNRPLLIFCKFLIGQLLFVVLKKGVGYAQRSLLVPKCLSSFAKQPKLFYDIWIYFFKINTEF